MKIAIINSVANGSSGSIVLDLSHLLSENCIDNRVFFGVGECSDDKVKSYRFDTPIEIKFSILLTRLFGRHSFYSVFATKRLISKLEKYKPDVVHLHQMHGHYINIKLLFNYLKRKKIKTVWTCHDCWPVTGHCAHFDNIGCEKWVSGCKDCEQLNKYPISIHDASAVNWERKKTLISDWDDLTIVTPSFWLKSVFERSFFKGKNINCIYNGVDRNIFRPNAQNNFRKKYGLENKYIIFSVYKGHEARSKIYAELANKLNDDEVLVISAADSRLKSILPKSVITLPYMGKKELAELYSEADVYFNETLEESFCLVAAESISCGTPVVCCNRTAIPEIVGDCGVALDIYDADNIYSAIQTVKQNKYECEKRAEMFFDKDKNYVRYLELYGVKERK